MDVTYRDCCGTPANPELAMGHANGCAVAKARANRYFTDPELFDAEHNWRKGCELARTAGSATLECDTHHAYLSVDIPVALRSL